MLNPQEVKDLIKYCIFAKVNLRTINNDFTTRDGTPVFDLTIANNTYKRSIQRTLDRVSSGSDTAIYEPLPRDYDPNDYIVPKGTDSVRLEVFDQFYDVQRDTMAKSSKSPKSSKSTKSSKKEEDSGDESTASTDSVQVTNHNPSNKGPGKGFNSCAPTRANKVIQGFRCDYVILLQDHSDSLCGTTSRPWNILHSQTKRGKVDADGQFHSSFFLVVPVPACKHMTSACFDNPGILLDSGRGIILTLPNGHDVQALNVNKSKKQVENDKSCCVSMSQSLGVLRTKLRNTQNDTVTVCVMFPKGVLCTNQMFQERWALEKNPAGVSCSIILTTGEDQKPYKTELATFIPNEASYVYTMKIVEQDTAGRRFEEKTDRRSILAKQRALNQVLGGESTDADTVYASESDYESN